MSRPWLGTLDHLRSRRTQTSEGLIDMVFLAVLDGKHAVRACQSAIIHYVPSTMNVAKTRKSIQKTMIVFEQELSHVG
jgi:hypothetical protein